jgi:hypothetical protein
VTEEGFETMDSRYGLLGDGDSQVSTADILEKMPKNNPLRKYLMGILGPIAQGVGSIAGQNYNMVKNPAKGTENTLRAGAAGVASIGSPLYPDDMNRYLEGEMAKDPYASTVAPFAAPLPIKGLGLLSKAPKTVAGASAAASFPLASVAAGDEDGKKSYSERLMTLQQQQNEAFQALEGIRRDISQTEEKERAKFKNMTARELQALVGAKVDGRIGPETKAKIEKYINGKVDSAKRSQEQRMQSLQARYDTLNSGVDDLKRTESPEAIRELQKRTRIGELFPDETLAMQGLLAGGGLLSDIVSRGKSRMAFNRNVRAANKGAAEALDAAEDAYSKGKMGTATREAGKAGHFTDAAHSYRDNGGSFIPWGTVAGFETGAFAPDLIDYTRSKVSGSKELEKSVLEGVAGNPENRNFPFEPLTYRAGLSIGGGVAAGKLGKHLTASAMPRAYPQEFAPGLQTLEDGIAGLHGSRADLLYKDANALAKVDAKALSQQKAAKPRKIPPPKKTQDQRQISGPAQNQNVAIDPPAPTMRQPTSDDLTRAERMRQYDIQVAGKKPKPDEYYIRQAMDDPKRFAHTRFKEDRDTERALTKHKNLYGKN